MPTIYLSPSLQPFNKYVNGGDEQTVMNQVADAMEPYLRAAGIRFTRNRIGMTLGEAIRESNAGYYGPASGPPLQCRPREPFRQAPGVPTSIIIPEAPRAGGRQRCWRKTSKKYTRTPLRSGQCPLPAWWSSPKPTRRLSSWRSPITTTRRTPVGLRKISRLLQPISSRGCVSILGFPLSPIPSRRKRGTVVTQSSPLNIRKRAFYPGTGPSPRPQKGEQLTVLGKWQGWYVVEVHGIIGYASAEYIQV